ncbi:hypothetical protein KCP74_01975 [Salmonella enterica subsp. enterica]|nr:hypothetical protein KCP74_01975 [Salmonella enterica subsp. enterica]
MGLRFVGVYRGGVGCVASREAQSLTRSQSATRRVTHYIIRGRGRSAGWRKDYRATEGSW